MLGSLGLSLPEHPYETIVEETHHGGVRESRQAMTSVPNTRKRLLLRAAGLCGAVLCSVALWASVRNNTLSQTEAGLVGHSAQGQQLYELGRMSTASAREQAQDVDVSKQVSVTNKYQWGEDSTHKASMYPWEHVAEPMMETRLEISSWPVGDDEAGPLNFMWHVNGDFVGTGAAISTVFHQPGAYQCSVSAHVSREAGNEQVGLSAAVADGTTPVADRLDFTVVVKYVRREIRALTDRDRETYFNAVSVMQRVPSAIGRALYGSNYYSKDYFNRMHLHYSGRQDCDHWHAGGGFITTHISVTLMYEQSLQAINPSIALPYWDFTIEGTYYDWSNFRQNSPIFADDWYGESAPENAMRTPTRGRFAYVPAMTNATEYSVLHNSYGMLHSRWNNDPTPFLTRTDQLMGFRNNRKPSGCRKYRSTYNSDNWMTLEATLNANAHGHIHELVGGTWSLNATAWADITSPIVQPFVHVAVKYYKYLWRAGYVDCPETCAVGLPWEKCVCQCSEEAFNGMSPQEVLLDAEVFAFGSVFYDQDFVLIDSVLDDEGNPYDVLPGYTKRETDDIYAKLLAALCTPMRIGTHYDATSTDDPTFWPMHPSFDRLWHLKRLSHDPDFDDTWTATNECYGHNPEDIHAFHDLFLGSKSEAPEGQDTQTQVESPKMYYNNQELYDLLRPDGMEIPYMYDSTTWPQCEEQGIFIGV